MYFVSATLYHVILTMTDYTQYHRYHLYLKLLYILLKINWFLYTGTDNIIFIVFLFLEKNSL
jgi:hypothetical protein